MESTGNSVKTAGLILLHLRRAGIVPQEKNIEHVDIEKIGKGKVRNFRKVTYTLSGGWKVIAISISTENKRRWIAQYAVVFVNGKRFDLSIQQFEPFILWKQIDQDLLLIWS